MAQEVEDLAVDQTAEPASGTAGERGEGVGGVADTKTPTLCSADVPSECWTTIPRKPHVVGDDAFIPLTKGLIAVIDRADLYLVEGHNWYAHGGGGGRQYAARTVTANGAQRAMYMHKVIALPMPGQDVDHIDGDGLNNRRANLRACSRQQNLANTGARKANKVGAKGVWKHGLKFRASITIGGKTVHLGGFPTLDEAAAAYRAAAEREHGEFAPSPPLHIQNEG